LALKGRSPCRDRSTSGSLGHRVGGPKSTHEELAGPNVALMHRLRVVPVVALALALSPLTAGCSSGSKPVAGGTRSRSTVSASDRACRDRWHALGQELGDKAARGVMVRRAFESRWESIGAGIGYYASTANADQCGDLLVTQQKAIADLDGVVTRALPYDLERRAASATDDRTQWRSAHPVAKEPKRVRLAYRTLRISVPRASSDLSPAITELAAVDPGRARAVRRGIADLTLLANASDAYVTSNLALARIQAFQHPPRKKG
jgi:hypothetical protein